MQAKLQCLGGVAGGITGSSYYLTVTNGKNTTRVLFDIGLVQCRFKESLEKNQEILKYFRPKDLDYVVLTHSHIDHIGRLPLLAKNGFSGQIICTEGTKNLLEAMLEDSAKIQVAEANYLKAHNKKKSRIQNHRSKQNLGDYDRQKEKQKKEKNQFTPLYTLSDAQLVPGMVKNNVCNYHEWIRLSKDLSVKFYPSGHVMGGAIIVAKIKTKKKETHLCFTGDLGRQDGIILPPPEYVTEPLDYLVIESTYGGEIHPSREVETKKLLDLVKISAEKGKRIIIPSFALERSQEIIYLLSYYMEEGVIPKTTIYLDSPLGKKITECFSGGWENGMFVDQGKLKFNPFNPAENPYFQIITEKKDSDALIAKSGHYIVVAGSGMCDAGRVRGHLRANLEKSDTMVFLVGYMTANSLGRQLKDGRKTVRMNGQEIQVRAEIDSFDSFSAHADSPFLNDYTLRVLSNGQNSLKNVFIVHGEGLSAIKLKNELSKKLRSRKINAIIEIPPLNYERIIE